MRRVFSLGNTPMDVRQTIEERLDSVYEDNPELSTNHFLVHSDDHDVHWKFARGESDGEPAHPDQPYYVASVGKAFTASLIHILKERGDLSLPDSIADYLDDDIMDGLHVYDGTEYFADIRIDHLLTHTSGLLHFYQEPTDDGRDFTDIT